jgi:hypothetical protein
LDTREYARGGIHVTVDKMAPEAIAETQRVLHVDGVARFALSHGAARERFRNHVERNSIPLECGCGKADAVDSD